MHSKQVVSALFCVIAIFISGCAVGAKSPSTDPITSTPNGTDSTPTAGAVQDKNSMATDQASAQASAPKESQNSALDTVPEAEVKRLLDAAHSHPYTMTWEVTGDFQPNDWGHELLYRRWGRTGVMPNGDRYVLLEYDGFMHRGNQAWYLYMDKDRIMSDPPEAGRLHQRPAIQMWEAIKPDELGVLDGIWRNSLAFKRVKTGTDTEQWISTVPSRKSSLDLFGHGQDIVELWVTVRRIDKVFLPVRFHVTWWNGRPFNFDGIYDWNPPVFPEVTGG